MSLLGVSSTFSTFSTRLISLPLLHVLLISTANNEPPLVYIFYTVKPVRAAGTAAPTGGRPTTTPNPVRPVNPVYPPPIPFYILYTVNKLRWATKASLTFRHLLRAPRPQPTVGAAVPCRPPPPLRPRSGLSKNLFAFICERYPRSP